MFTELERALKQARMDPNLRTTVRSLYLNPQISDEEIKGILPAGGTIQDVQFLLRPRAQQLIDQE